MNTPILPSLSPAALILLKGTILLALAWIAHLILRNRHARWRIILWRSALCTGIAIPFLQLSPVALYTVTVDAHTTFTSDAVPAPGDTPQSGSAAPSAALHNPEPAPASPPQIIDPHSAPKSGAPWIPNLFAIWITGGILCALRLLYFAIHLSRLRSSALPANEQITALAANLQQQLGITTTPFLKISGAVQSPFLCGLLRPVIILPQALIASISNAELSALLRHELAHLRNHDLFWTLSWRCAAVVLWFHPLAWKIPAAHNLACEEEADRLATGDSQNAEPYSRTLAQLALRVLALPPVETKLTLNASSEIVQRLRALKRDMPAWNGRHSVISAALALLLLAIAAGGKFIPGNAAELDERTTSATGTLTVHVEDEDGKPLEGATLELWGYRVKGHDSASHYSFASRQKFRTDSKGKAVVPYPIEANPEEKQLTGKLSFIVSHPEFAIRTTELFVDAPPSPIRLERGATIVVSGYFGPDRQLISNLVPNLSGDPSPKWTGNSLGVMTNSHVPAGGYMLQLYGKSPSGQLIHSEAITFQAEKGKRYRFDLELKPGVRLVGKLDDSVPRPVRHARAIISVRPSQIPASAVPEDLGEFHKKYGYFQYWRSHRPIAADGSFTFESIPPGEVDVIVLGEGFASRNGAQPMNRIDGNLEAGGVIGVPQSFPLTSPETRITVATEKTATIEVIAKNKSGEPIEGATIYINPNVMRMQTGIFGHTGPSSEATFREIEFLPQPTYRTTTDEDGRALLQNVPIVTRHLDLDHADFAVPIQPTFQDRTIRFTLAPGETKKINLTLESKGTTHLGTLK